MLHWDEIKAKFSDGSMASFYRAKVPGGWLVGIFLSGQAVSITFYPDPDHKWDGSSLP
jgi:hypothetical protein